MSDLQGQQQDSNLTNAIGKGFDAATKTVSVSKKVSRIANEKRAAERAKRQLENMSDEDLRKLVERIELERQYSSLKTETVNRGKVRARDVLSIAGDVVGIAAAAIGIAVAIKKLKDG